MRRFVALLCSLGLWSVAIAAADLAAVRHVPHFAAVNEHLYRGGQPAPEGLDELKRLGIKRVIDLRGKGETGMNEGSALAKSGIEYINIPFPAFHAPTQEDVGTALALLMGKDDVPTFVHCLRGKDRTGTLIACYRIQHDRWTREQALAEAKEHGMSKLERGMRSFVMHFSAVPGDGL